MDRRLFVRLTGLGVLGLSGPAMAGVSLLPSWPVSAAAARIGRRMQATLTPEVLFSVGEVMASLPAVPGEGLAVRVAADHRAGRIVKVGGVSLALTEAAWCLAAAQAQALS